MMTHEGIWVSSWVTEVRELLRRGMGSRGLEAIKKIHPDLVLSDIKMPGMDLFELLRQIRAFGPDCVSSVPVIAMTAFVSHADRARMLNAGFQGCLPKPFTPDKLVETILTVLDR